MIQKIGKQDTKISTPKIQIQASHHRIGYTEGRLLGFSYDFGVTRNSSSNADAMVLASARRRGIHPLIIFKMADVQGGGMLLKRALARTMASAF
jgi:hypothetical protein